MRWEITTAGGVKLGAVRAMTREQAIAEASRRYNIASDRLRARLAEG